MYNTALVQPLAGSFLSAIEPFLLAQGWSMIYSPAANDKWYRSPGSLADRQIHIHILDTLTTSVGLATCVSSPVGGGSIVAATSYRYIRKPASGFAPTFFHITADYVFAAIKALNGVCYYDAFYVGGLLSYATPPDFPQVVLGASIAAPVCPSGYNHLLHGASFGTACAFVAANSAGMLNQPYSMIALNSCFSATQLPNPASGKIIASPLILGALNLEIRGQLIDCYSVQGSLLESEDIILIDGVDFHVYNIGTYRVAVSV